MNLSFTEVYAVPGANSIIDGIHPVTGLTCVFGNTEAEVREREPLAVRMTWEAWRAEQVAQQNTPITWEPSTRAQYWEMLEVLPPAAQIGGGFLVGEPMDHSFETGAPRFSAYRERAGEVFEVASRPLTIAEFRAELGR